MKKLRLPFGVQDYMPQECYNINRTQEQLASVFVKHGFRRVSMPAIEFYDVYDDILSRATVNKTFKMTDSDGSLLMLRFDPTLQICRMAATKLSAERADKVYYIENSYEYISDPSTARSREFLQAGVELLGSSGVAGDIEAVAMAVECLSATGLQDFLVEIGQVEYFNGIAGEAGLSDADANALRAFLNRKDMLGAEMFLREKKVRDTFAAQFLLLPTLFGDAEVLARARAGVANERSLRALDNLQQILSALKAMGWENRVTVDLGLLRGEYYTGTVLKGISGNLGMPLLDGGRYDALCASFGHAMPAVGFSVGIKRLLMALENEDKLVRDPAADYAYIADGKDVAFEYAYVNRLRADGQTVEKRFDATESELFAYCKARGIAKALVIEGGAARAATEEKTCNS